MLTIKPTDIREEPTWGFECPYCGGWSVYWDNPKNEAELMCTSCKETVKVEE